MEKKRPIGVTVIAILNFVFGGIGLAALLCVGCGGGIAAIALSNAPANDPGMADLRAMGESFQNKIPYIVPYLIFSLVLGLIMNVIMVSAGFGLLKMRSWARSACIFVAIVSLITGVGGFVYSVAYMNPGMAEFQKDIHEIQMKKLGGRRAPPPPMQNPAISMVSSAFGLVIGAIYPIATLWIMFLPSVVAAFRNWDRDDESGGYRDEGDDHFERDRERDYEY